MNIRHAKLDDVTALVEIHRHAFAGFFLTSLGPRFLTALYRGFVIQEFGLCLIACENGFPIGFVAGTRTPKKFFRRLFFLGWHEFVIAAGPALLRQPVRVGKRLVRGISYRGDSPPTVNDAALLSSIGVRPEFGGKGVGRQLIEAFCAQMHVQGARAVYLETDAEQNEGINLLYSRCGFQKIAHTSRRGGRKMNHYLRNL